MNNAIKYTNKGYVKLKIDIVQQNQYFKIKIEVEDTGIGKIGRASCRERV